MVGFLSKVRFIPFITRCWVIDGEGSAQLLRPAASLPLLFFIFVTFIHRDGASVVTAPSGDPDAHDHAQLA